MNHIVIGLESSSIMPLVAVTPLTQSCYQTFWGHHLQDTFITHEDTINELKEIFRFKADTFYSNPIRRMEKVKEFPPSRGVSLKGTAFKLLLDGQMGGWFGNKNSRVQAFFFSDVIDAVDDTIGDPKAFCESLVGGMERKLQTYRNLLTPVDAELTIDLRQILPYWGLHNVSASLLREERTLTIRVMPDCAPADMFQSFPRGTWRDAYHYHMLKQQRVNLILVGDANYRKNLCHCADCKTYECEVEILTDNERKRLLRLT